MRYLRQTLWTSPTQGFHAVIPASDLKQDPHHVASELRQRLQTDQNSDYIDVEVHEIPEELTLPELSLRVQETVRRPHTPEERHTHTLVDWLIAQLPQLNPSGVLATSLPAPLSATEISAALPRVLAHPAYQDQIVRVIANDNRLVVAGPGKTIQIVPLTPSE